MVVGGSCMITVRRWQSESVAGSIASIRTCRRSATTERAARRECLGWSGASPIGIKLSLFDQGVAGVERSEPPGMRQLAPNVVFSVGEGARSSAGGSLSFDLSHPFAILVLKRRNHRLPFLRRRRSPRWPAAGRRGNGCCRRHRFRGELATLPWPPARVFPDNTRRRI